MKERPRFLQGRSFIVENYVEMWKRPSILTFPSLLLVSF